MKQIKRKIKKFELKDNLHFAIKRLFEFFKCFNSILMSLSSFDSERNVENDNKF